jgi:hypothetical protein
MEHLDPLAGTLPAMFAKSAMLWTSLVYIFSNKQIRSKICFFKPEAKPPEVSISRGIFIPFPF